MGQARLRVMIVSERPRRGAGGARRTTLRLVPRWGEGRRAAIVPATPLRPTASGPLGGVR